MNFLSFFIKNTGGQSRNEGQGSWSQQSSSGSGWNQQQQQTGGGSWNQGGWNQNYPQGKFNRKCIDRIH